MEPGLVEPETLDLLACASGGIPVWLVALMRSAALYALERQARSIADVDAKAAIKDLRRDTLAPLSRDDYRVLRQRHRDRRLTNDPAEQRLLYNGSLIEYPNEVPWCDAHPVLWSLLEGPEEDGEDGDPAAAD